MATGTTPGAAVQSVTSEETVIDNIFSRQAEVGTQDDATWEDESGDQQPSEKKPAKTATERTPEEELEAEESESTEEESSTEEDEQSKTTVEESKFKLPSQQAKDYDKSVWAHYAKRFGFQPDEVEANPAVKDLLKAKIDSDIFIQQQSARLKTLQIRQDETETEEATAALTPEQAEKNRTDWLANLEKYANQVTDPHIAKQVAEEFFQAFGVSKENIAEMEKQGQSPAKIVNTLSKFGISLMSTVAPQLLNQWVEAAFPGFGNMYYRTLSGDVWEGLRNKDESLKSLPAYGTTEFRQMMKQVMDANPDLQTMVFTDKNGRPLSDRDQIRMQYKTAALIATGQQVTPDVVRNAFETGRKTQAAAASRASLGKLNAGKSTGKFASGSEKKKAGSGLGIVEEYNQREGIL